MAICSKCPNFIKPRLNHPEHLCPYRMGGPLNRRTRRNWQTKRIDSDIPPIKYTLTESATYQPKICALSNGIDLPLQADVTIEPLQTKKVNLGVRFIIPEKHCGLLMNKSSALTKFGIKVTLGLIDYGFNGEIETVLENTKSQSITLQKGTAVCQLLILPAEVPTLQKDWIEPATKRGSFGSTGQDS